MSKKTAHFACIGAAAVLLFSVFTLCLSPAYANSAGVAWLEAQSCPDDGCYASAGDIGAPFQAAAETLRAFYLLDETAGLADALAYMNAAPPSPRSAKNLSRTLIANVLAGQSAASPAVVELAGALGACVNEDGGIGDLPGYDSTALDTAFALEAAAMTEMNAELAGALQPTLIYLLERQRGDGGWSDSVNDASDVYTAAIAMYALWHYRHYFPENIPPALDKARDFLLGARNAENLWGETFESALALIALSAYVTDLSVLEGSADALRAQQAADGSWESDVYATALCLRALWLYDTQKSDVASRTGHVSGTVLGADSGAAMAGVRVYLDSNPGKTAITDSGGRFLLTGVPAGRHTLLIGKTGYAETGVAIAAGPGSVTDIGEFSLYPVTDANAPAKLTLLGTVIDGISNLPVANAAVLFTAGGDGQTTNIDGDFIFEGIAVRDFQLTIHAAGYASKTYDVSASAFGEAYMTFVLPPANSGPPALVTTLTGAVSDEATGLPAANAEISMADSGQSAMADDVTGRYLLAQIDSLAFTIQVTAPGYASKSYTMEVSQHGTYNLDMELAALPDAAEYRFQIMAIQPLQAETGANANALFSVKAANLAEEAASVLLIGEILDAKGASVANVTPYLPGTEMRAGEFSFAGGEVRELTVPWYTAQMAPGVYRLVLRVTEPGTLSRIVPRGHVLAEESAYVTVTETPAVSGEPAFDPPLLQAGFDTPVTLSALLLNSGNVALASGSYVLRIRDESGTLLHSVQADSPNLEAGRHRMLAFGSWTPSLPGNLRASVTAADAAVRGEIAGVLYVGNKASGTFSADREVMPEGTHTVHGSISMSGVDITAGQSTDPLFFAVREAVRKGGKYTAAEAMQWHHSKRCLGCHIQAQSLMGLASSLDKADTDPEATRFLYDAIAGSQQSDGSLATMARSGYKTTQTSLGLWSLTAWPDKEASFRTMYKAAGYLHDRRRSSGNKTYWHSSYPSYWFSGNIVQTALTVMGFADIVKTARNIDISGVRDYKLVELARLSRGYSVADMEIGADGTLYLLSITNYPPSARVDRFNAETGEITNVATGFSGYSRGFAILPDGTLYVADLRRIIQIRPDGSRESVWSQPSGYIYDVELGPDGFLYLADYYGRLLRVARDGSSMEVLASGGLLSNPTYLAFDAAGSLYAANYAAYNVLKLAPDGAPEIFADELAYMPAGLTAGVDGGLYVAATNRSQYKRGPIYRIDADGAVELLRLPGGSQLGSPAETNGRIFVADNSAGYLHEMVRKELDISSFQVDVEGAVRWFLSNYQESSPDKAVHSMRLAALAEARDAVSDDSLPPQIDEAVNYEAVWLRERQNPDGGWGRYDGQASDPLITAMAGLALDYTDPSSEDPMVRNTIRYLLDTQDAGDGSWENVNNRFKDTRLAATSFVMAYLPKALVRLGGIDVDLHLRLPDSILLGSPGIAPSRESAGTDGSTEYIWHLQGVTSTGRTLEFDLTLSDMLHDEVRATAEAAWLEFDNSFVDQKMRLDLEIPSIRAFSGLSLDTSIDKAIYTNDEAVQITVRTENTAALAIDRLSVELLVEDADGNTAATLA
ncbi:MAG: hypothetical protein GY862_29620, partial [Gammaproteobacteria bacterium]|nr:hypothetical protein [Gammaproteobacteria bacterium]